jgi:hypothetical protein
VLIPGMIMQQMAIRYHVSRTSKARSTALRVWRGGNLKLLNVGMDVRDTAVAVQINVERECPLKKLKCPLLLRLIICICSF